MNKLCYIIIIYFFTSNILPYTAQEEMYTNIMYCIEKQRNNYNREIQIVLADIVNDTPNKTFCYLSHFII